MRKFTLLLAIAIVTALGATAQSGLIGYYDFADGADLFKNTATESGVGTVMCEGVMKFLPDAPSGSEDDQPSVEGTDWEVVDGVKDNAISMNEHNWFKVWHGIPANGGGDYVNDFTVVIDVKVSDADGIYSLLEVNPTPKENGYTSELEIAEGMKVGSVGAPSSDYDALGFSENAMTVDEFHRVIYAAKLSQGIYIYVDGELWHSMEGDFLDARPAPYGADNNPDDAAFKVGGNNEGLPANDPPRDGAKVVDLVAVYNTTLTADEVAALGGAGTWLGQSELAENETIKVYPNPANDFLNIVVEDNAVVEIISITGQVVERVNVIGNTRVDISSLNSGVYFVRVNNTVSQKLIVE